MSRESYYDRDGLTIQMLEDGRWWDLGGKYRGDEVAEKIGQFERCYYGAPAKNTGVICKRLFRVKGGYWA